jgi:hypothetical protein
MLTTPIRMSIRSSEYYRINRSVKSFCPIFLTFYLNTGIFFDLVDDCSSKSKDCVAILTNIKNNSP